MYKYNIADGNRQIQEVDILPFAPPLKAYK